MGGLRRLGAAAVALTLLAGMSACGDDGGGDGDEASATTSGTEDEGSGNEDESSGDDVDVDSAFVGEECEEFSEAFINAGASLGGAFGGGGDEDLEDVAGYFEEISDNVPDEIGDAFETYAEAFAAYARALADADVDLSDPSNIDPEDAQALAAAGEAFSEPEVQEASEAITTYVSENCGAAAN
jgi:hypothetical protein